MADRLAPLRAAYVTQMQRAYSQSTRGIATPEQRRAWEADARGMIAAHDREEAEKAWDEGYDSAMRDEDRGSSINPYSEGGAS